MDVHSDGILQFSVALCSLCAPCVRQSVTVTVGGFRVRLYWSSALKEGTAIDVVFISHAERQGVLSV